MTASTRRLGAILFLAALAAVPPAAQGKEKAKLGEIVGLGRGLTEAASNSAPSSGLEIQRRSFGVVQDAKLDAALKGLLEELRAAAPGDRPEAGVYATPDPAFRALTTPDGTIFLAYGVLRSVQSRDELAALIAHEYAHVALGHVKPTQAERMLKLASGGSRLYAEHRWAGGSSAELDEAAHRMAVFGAAMESVQSGVMPSRSRRQETAADAYAVDLMVATGYNPVAVVDMLSRMGTWEAAQDAAFERHKLAMVNIEALTANAAGASSMSGAVDNVIAGGVQNAWSSGVNALNSGLRKARRQHLSPERRTEDVISHLEKQHPDADRPELRPLPWAGDRQVVALFDGIDKTHAFIAALAADDKPRFTGLKRDIQGSPVASTPYARYALFQVFDERAGRQKAISDVQTELRRADSLFPTHLLVLDILIRHGGVQEQLAALEQSQESLGDPPELLPYAVRIYSRANDKARAFMAYKRCAGFGDAALQAACGEAAK